MISFISLILESFDVYTLPEMDSKGMQYEIKEENRANFEVSFEVKGKKYFVEAKKNRGSVLGTHATLFGDYGDNGVKNVSKLTNQGIPLAVCTRVFSLLKYYLDKYKIESISYLTAPDRTDSKDPTKQTRKTIYDQYFEKNFPEYEKEDSVDSKEPDTTVTVWHRK